MWHARARPAGRQAPLPSPSARPHPPSNRTPRLPFRGPRVAKPRARGRRRIRPAKNTRFCARARPVSVSRGAAAAGARARAPSKHTRTRLFFFFVARVSPVRSHAPRRAHFSFHALVFLFRMKYQVLSLLEVRVKAQDTKKKKGRKARQHKYSTNATPVFFVLKTCKSLK